MKRYIFLLLILLLLPFQGQSAEVYRKITSDELATDFSNITTGSAQAIGVITATNPAVYYPTPSTEKLTNGDFATNDLTGWSNTSIGTGTVDASTGACVIVSTDSSNRGQVSQTVSVASGDYCEATFTISGGGQNSFIQITNSDFTPVSVASGNTVTSYFTATSSSPTIVFIVAGNNGTTTIDDVSIKSLGPATGSQTIAGCTPVVDGSGDPVAIGHGEIVNLGTWTDDHVELNIDLSDASGNITDGYMIPASTDWTVSDPATGSQTIAGCTPVVDGSGDPVAIGHGEIVNLGTWTDDHVELNIDLSDMVSDVQDPATFSETDPVGVVSISGNVVTLTAGDRDEDYYRTKDFGAGHFGDFNHWVDVNVTALTDNSDSIFPFWAVSNADDDLKDIDDLGGDALFLSADRSDATHYLIRLYNIDAGSITLEQTSSAISVNTPSYVSVVRKSSDLILNVYSTEALRIAGGNGDINSSTDDVVGSKFQFVYYIGSYNNGGTAKDISGTVSNLRINEIDDGSMIPATLTDWTLSDPAIGPFTVMDPALISTGTLTAGTTYFVNTTEVDNFGSGVVQYEYFTAVGTETCDANNTVYEVLSTALNVTGEQIGAVTATLPSVLTIGNINNFNYTMTRTAGTLTPYFGTNAGSPKSASGTYRDYKMTLGNTNLIYSFDSDFEGAVESSGLSLKDGKPVKIKMKNKIH